MLFVVILFLLCFMLLFLFMLWYIIEYISCGVPPAISNGYISTNSTLIGSIGYVMCNSPYILRNDFNYVCTNIGRWMGNGTCSKYL